MQNAVHFYGKVTANIHKKGDNAAFDFFFLAVKAVIFIKKEKQTHSSVSPYYRLLHYYLYLKLEEVLSVIIAYIFYHLSHTLHL